jgi:esterase/lipase
MEKKPKSFRLRKEFLRTHFLQRYEFDRSVHIPRDDRSFLFLQEGPASVCLLYHGAQGSPAEMRELGSYLYSRGYTVYCPRFSRVDIKERMVSWESWVTDAETSLKVVMEYSPHVHLVGLSLGATFSIILSGAHRPSTLVLLAPAIYQKFKLKERFYALGRKLLPTLFFRLAGWHGEVIKAMEHVRNAPRQIEQPVLALQAMDDIRLSTRGLKWIRTCATHAQSEVVLLPRGSHTLTRGSAKEEVFQRIYAFLQKF